eukprot:6015055-Prymnesium_polylepis.1
MPPAAAGSAMSTSSICNGCRQHDERRARARDTNETLARNARKRIRVQRRHHARSQYRNTVADGRCCRQRRYR